MDVAIGNRELTCYQIICTACLFLDQLIQHVTYDDHRNGLFEFWLVNTLYNYKDSLKDKDLCK